jgi:hypothetical protein
MLYFAVVTIVMVEETSWCHQQYLNTSDSGSSQATDVTESEMFLSLAVIIQIGHDMQHGLKDYCTVSLTSYTIVQQNMTLERFLQAH